MLNKIRFYLLKLIIGKHPVAFNCSFDRIRGLEIDNSKHWAYMYNVKITNTETAIEVKV